MKNENPTDYSEVSEEIFEDYDPKQYDPDSYEEEEEGGEERTTVPEGWEREKADYEARLAEYEAKLNNIGGSTSKLESDLKSVQSEIESFDFADHEDGTKAFQALVEKKLKLESELKTIKEAPSFAKENASTFVSVQKKIKDEMGTTLTPTEWTEIRKIATSLAGGKAVTEDNVMSAVFNHIGMERYNSMVALSGEHQARRGMKTATAKTTPKDKSAGGTRRFSELSEGEKAHAIGRMSPQQFAKYYKDTYGRDLNE